MVDPDQIPNNDLKWSQIRKDQHRFVTRPIEEMLNTTYLGRMATFTGNKEAKAETFCTRNYSSYNHQRKGTRYSNTCNIYYD